MATDRQSRALEKMVEYGSKSRRLKKGVKAKILREVGYSDAVVTQPDKVFASKGFLELCDEVGLTDEFLSKALYADIKKKPQKREKELRLAFQIKGKLKNDGEPGNGNIFNFNFFGNDQLKRVASRVLDGDSESTRTPNRLQDSN